MSGQRLNGKRFVLGKQARRDAVIAEVATHHLVLNARLAQTPVLPKATAALAAAQTQLGLPYGITSCRCEPRPCSRRDCSGLIFFAINTVSGTNLCGSSFSLAAIGRDHGTEISEEQAIWTPGAIAIRCAFCDPNFNGSNGHVVWMMGDGQRTCEEGGHATGCYYGHATGRGFDLWMTYPGLDYSTAVQSAEEITMFVQTQHYDAKTGKPTGPASPPQGREDETPVVRVADDGSCIEAKFGATIAEDQPADAARPFILRRWYPQRPLPAGHRFNGVAFKESTVADPFPGGVATVTDGTTRRFRLS